MVRGVFVDAIVLAGGRSSRLGSTPKATLIYERHTLLERTVTAVSSLRRTVIVGGADVLTCLGQVLLTREDPPYGGPAAGIAAGVVALAAADSHPSDYIIVLACDMPLVATATEKLIDLLPQYADSDGLIASDGQRLQPLVAAYKTTKLTSALATQRRSGGLDGLSVARLIATLNLTPVIAPDGSTDDVDTWVDAAHFGIVAPAAQSTTREKS